MANKLNRESLGNFSHTAFSNAQGSLTRDRFALSTFLISFFSVLFQSSLILVSGGKLPPQVPIFYSKPWGETMLANPIFLWLLPAICLLVLIVNFTVAIFFTFKNFFLTRILYGFSLIIALMTLYGMGKIISLLL